MYREQIIVPHGEINKIAKACKCSRTYTSLALKFVYDSDKAKLIREEAIKYHRGIKIKQPI